jgi:hypothetical protein
VHLGRREGETAASREEGVGVGLPRTATADPKFRSSRAPFNNSRFGQIETFNFSLIFL